MGLNFYDYHNYEKHWANWFIIIKANNSISEHTQNIRFTVLGVMLHYTHFLWMFKNQKKKSESVPAPEALLGQIAKIRQKFN